MSALIVPALGFTADHAQVSTEKTKMTLGGRVASPGTSQSRSTSAGSATPPQSSIGDESGRSPVLSLAQALEDPFAGVNKMPVGIRNTFIDAPIGRPLSLEGFFTERAIHSCPVSRPVSLDEAVPPPGLVSSRPTSFDEVGAPPGLENLTRGNVDKSVKVINPADQDPFYVIRNTFIDTVVQRPLSLEGFLTERETRSCPATRHGSFDDMELPPGLQSLLESMDEACPPASPARSGKVDERPPSVDACTFVPGSYCAGVTGVPPVPPPPMNWGPVFTPPVTAPPPPAFSPNACVLQLSQMLSEPEAYSASLPSEGSAGHHLGDCKPCAFFYTKGCGNGSKCSFCHLCGPDEKKRRKSEKKQGRRLVSDSYSSYNVPFPAR